MHKKMKTKRKKEISGWITEEHMEAGFRTVKKNAQVLDYVMPCWLSAKENGEVKEKRGEISNQLWRFCQENKIGIMPLIGGAPKEVSNMLNNKSLAQKHINLLTEYVQDNHLMGIDVDYEFLPDTDRYTFTEFIRRLSENFHRYRKVVSVDLHPKVRPADRWDYGGIAQDWGNLVKYADILRVMCYDQHHFGYPIPDPGPVSSPIWAEAVMTYAVTVIPKNKLIMGIPFYGFDFDLADNKKSRYLTYQEAKKIAKEYGISISFDKLLKVPHFSYQDDQKHLHQVWFEDHRSLSYKLDIVNKFNVRGVSIWCFYDEDPRNWETMAKKLFI